MAFPPRPAMVHVPMMDCTGRRKPSWAPAAGVAQLLAAAVHHRIVTGPHAGRKALTLHIWRKWPYLP